MNAVIYLPYIFKHCSKCGELLPATHLFFSLNKDGKYGLHSLCRNCTRANVRSHYATHKEAIDQKHREYDAKNHLCKLARNRKYMAEMRESNPEKYRELDNRWWREHPDKNRAKSHRQRARRNGAEGSTIPFNEQAQLKRQRGKCYYCGCKLDKYHVDHVIPISRGGSDHPDNKVLACPRCNLSKGSKLPHEWVQGGRLL